MRQRTGRGKGGRENDVPWGVRESREVGGAVTRQNLQFQTFLTISQKLKLFYLLMKSCIRLNSFKVFDECGIKHLINMALEG